MVVTFGVPKEDQILKRSTLSFYGMYWEFVKNTKTSMVYFETRRLPLYSIRIFRIQILV